jgi:signal transduction histidine kinase
MSTPDPKVEVTRAIESAMNELEVALAELDRVPTLDASTLAYVAHAMNNYLAVADATVDLLKHALRDHPDADVSVWLDGLQHVGALMHHMVVRLPRVTSVSEFPLKQEHTNLALLMGRACDYHRRGARHKNLVLSYHVVGEVPPVWADRVAVAVIADNLLSNAVKFSRSGGTINVQVSAGPGGVVCRIRDAGPGLSAVDISRLFQRGVTLEARPTAGESSMGYGLAIAKEFVDRLGGRLWCESNYGEGACFSFRLPYHPDDATGLPEA